MSKTAEAPRTSAISSPSFDDYNSQLQIAILKATRNAAALPGDVGFYTSMDKGLAQEVDACSSRVLSLTNRLLDLVATGESGVARGRKRARLESEDVVDNFRSIVVDPMDQLLEQSDIRLDEFRGLLKPPAIAVTTGHSNTPAQKPSKKPVPQGRLDPALQHASHLPKPQTQFRRKSDNSNYSTWQPSLRHKYNAQVPMGYRLSDIDDESGPASSHPYQYEVKHIRYPTHMFRYAEPITPKSFEETPFVWVDTPELLSVLLDKLRSAQEIAVDLEHHSYRTFSGFLCLMQISTRECDYIIDTLALRDELEDLNEIFTDPKIVKVFHGAESDIIWLQQDFNLYIVNLFDTYHASKVLDFPRHGLATLLEMYCDFTPDKRYQLADWRIRTDHFLKKMLDYARSDTHYLLYIYDNLRNALLDRSQSRAHTPSDPSFSNDPNPPAALLRDVLSRSEETALRAFEKEVYDEETGSGPGGWDLLARKWNKGYLTPSDGRSSLRLEVYKTVHSWRDRVARTEDESTRYVLPNHYLFSLAENPPAGMAALHNIFPSLPPIIRTRGKELLDAIRDCVKRSNAGSAVSPEEVDEAKELGIVSSMDTADVRIAKTSSVNLFGPKSTTETNLPSTPLSSLFGSASNVDRSPSQSGAYSTRKSALFNFGYVPSMSMSKRNRFAFRDVLLRIHSDLTVAPSIPKVEKDIVADIVVAAAAADVKEPAVLEQVEMAYVPPEKRREALPVVDDSIVVVGQKKRKRISKATKQKTSEPRSLVQNDGTPGLDVIDDEQATGVSAAADFAPFDLEVPGSNILDDGSDHEVDGAANRKKKHKGASGAFGYGNFKAPPKAHSQLHKGNVSQTFK